MTLRADMSHMPFRQLQATIVAAVLAVALVLIATLTNIDVLKLNLSIFGGIKAEEIDDIIVGFFLIFAGLLVDRIRIARERRHEAEIEAQKLRTLQATMRTVHDIVNNFLNSLLLFQMEAHAIAPLESMESLDHLIQETFEKLKALGDVESVREKQMGVGMGIDFHHTPKSFEGGVRDDFVKAEVRLP